MAGITGVENLTEFPLEITEEEREKIALFLNDINTIFPRERSVLIPILQEAQNRIGYLPPEAMCGIAEFLSIPRMDIYSVVTFYNQFRLNPPGEHSIRVCMGTACHVRGASSVVDEIERELKIKTGDTTEDMNFTDRKSVV